ncbi:phosphatase PAP2 family protein [Natrialba sp. PRR66]|uniref:phosphatase PAP2 family protein n=1 Tax=Natrialba sp. PRR66 TaxID=3098146 RepID=UPI002B1DF40B|nr:phosphatase PAP2 family protein [Natrialba sp. PRR66]
MSRGIGVFDPIQETIPEWAAIVVALVTQLGDIWFLAVLLGVLYWRRPRERGEILTVAGLGLAGFALITTLKYTFALPRPAHALVELETLSPTVRPLYEFTGTASGYGFPSGHALVTTVVYGSLAVRLSLWTLRRRVLAAGTLVTVVCLSRVALGVHFVVDVVAGIGIGLAFLLAVTGLLTRYPDDEQTVVFAIAAALSVAAVVASSATLDSMLVLLGSLGAVVGWRLVGRERLTAVPGSR